MYFNFEDDRPDTPTLASALTAREGVMASVILHLLFVILLLVTPELPFMKALEERRRQALEEQQRRALEKLRESARFVFVEPLDDTPAPKPPPEADLSDQDRQARTVIRPPDASNRLPFSRGNTPERIEAPPAPPRPVEPAPAPATPEPAAPAPPSRNGNEPSSEVPVPEVPRASEPSRQPERENGSSSPAAGVIAEAIRNVRKYAPKDGFMNLRGGIDQEIGPSIQFDTKGVEFGPWLRRFVAQIRSNWFIPYAAMSLRGHVVLTFYVHKDGRITEVAVLKPSSVDAFTRSAQNAILASDPTMPLPPEYPDDRAFFTVTFYFNENPDR